MQIMVNVRFLSILIFLVSYSTFSYSESIKLKPGYWQYQQVTTINGKSAPGRSLSGGECLLKENGDQPVEYYTAKFQAGLGPESKCDISNQTHGVQQVNFDLRCQSEGNIHSKHHIVYRYSETSVDITSTGTLSLSGQSLDIESSNQSVWARECSADEALFARDQNAMFQQPEMTTPLRKPLFTISADGAGPIRDSLYFRKSAIQALFPGFRIEKMDVQTYVGHSEVFSVRKNGEDVAIFQIDARQDLDVAFSVFTNSKKVSGPKKERIGVTKLKDIVGAKNQCGLGKNRLSQTVVCLEGNFRSLYEPPHKVFRKYAIGEHIPFDDLGQSVLVEMRYYLGYPNNKANKHGNHQHEGKVKGAVKRFTPDTFHSGLKALDSDKPIVVHFTSTDGSCPHCEKNNSVFQRFFEQHHAKYTFVEVAFNPWKSYLKKFKRLKGLPVTELYLDKVAVTSVMGHQKELASLVISANEQVQNLFDDDYDDVHIEKRLSTSLKEFVTGQSSDKLLLVNISSTDANCPACVKQNSFFRHAARQLSDNIQFTEILYEPYESVKSDAVLKQYLATQKTKINGLPATLIYKDGQFTGKRPGVWPSIGNDLQLFLKKR